jgi:acetyl esterase
MALDESTAAFVSSAMAAGSPPMGELTVAELREMTLGLRNLYGAGPPMARTWESSADSPTGPVSQRIHIPDGHPVGVIIYFFGGGWVTGSIDECDVLARTIASRTGCAVIVPAYRLAPEHMFPAAVEDAWASLVWADAHMIEVLGRRGPLMVAGDSAGANLAAVVSRWARDRQGPGIDLQILSCPVTDSDFGTESYCDPAYQLLLTRQSMEWFWAQYLPDPARRGDPDASPLRAATLAGIAPAVILTAENDVLRSEGEAYADRLRQDGVPVRHRRFSGQIHSFLTLVNVLPGSGQAIDYLAAAVADVLGGLPVQPVQLSTAPNGGA